MSDNIFEGVDLETFNDFENEGYSDEDALSLAGGLLEEAIPCLTSIYPKFNDAQRKVIKFAIFEMAKYIKIDYYNFERATSPFQSETIGSYTYSKMSTAVRNSTSTGVPGFDRAVAQFAGMCESGDGGTFSVSSEVVVRPGFDGFLNDREKIRGDEGYNAPAYPYRYGRL